MQWLEDHPAYAGLLVLADGRQQISSRMKVYLD
jgi:hypothetical protein